MKFREICLLQYSIIINTFWVDPHSDVLNNALVKPKNSRDRAMCDIYELNSVISLTNRIHDKNECLAIYYLTRPQIAILALSLLERLNQTFSHHNVIVL